MSNRTSNTKGNSLIALNFPIFVRQNPHQRCTTISVAKHQHSDNSLKIKCKAYKELEKDTPHKDAASLFGVSKNTHSTLEKKADQLLQSYECGLEAKIENTGKEWGT